MSHCCPHPQCHPSSSSLSTAWSSASLLDGVLDSGISSIGGRICGSGDGIVCGCSSGVDGCSVRSASSIDGDSSNSSISGGIDSGGVGSGDRIISVVGCGSGDSSVGGCSGGVSDSGVQSVSGVDGDSGWRPHLTFVITDGSPFTFAVTGPRGSLEQISGGGHGDSGFRDDNGAGGDDEGFRGVGNNEGFHGEGDDEGFCVIDDKKRHWRTGFTIIPL
mmetsp:Transcript_46891/g.99605  ORF Transcript_46891/g.99605 Transcript_46891/m.99605 type:complete len:218 (-) Transcript_46891:673-1326(-)